MKHSNKCRCEKCLLKIERYFTDKKKSELDAFFHEDNGYIIKDNYRKLLDDYWKLKSENEVLKRCLKKDRMTARPRTIIESYFDVYCNGVLQPWKIPADFEVIDTKDFIVWRMK